MGVTTGWENGECPPHPKDRIGQRAGSPQRSKRKAETGDRFKMLNEFVDFTMRDLSRREATTWMVLYRDTRDGKVRVSMEQIAERTGCSKRHTVLAIQSLCRKGLLRCAYRGGLNRGASVYVVSGGTATGDP